VQKSTATKPTGGNAALVIAPQWVGDAIMSLPLIAQLRREYDHVDVMAVPAVAAVYECCPQPIGRHVVAFAHGQLQWALRRQTADGFRGYYRTAVVLPNSLKSALIPWLAGIPVRRGMLGESRYLLINDRRSVPLTASASSRSRPSMLDQYLALADTPIAQHAIDRFGTHRPVMTIPSAPLSYHHLAGPELTLAQTLQQHRVLAICPGAEYGPAKQWPTALFADLVNNWLNADAHHAAIIIGGPKDIALGDEITSQYHHSRLLNLCGKTTLLEAFQWIARSQIVVSNDSGLMHAAAALGVPVVGLFGSSDPHHTPPHALAARALSLSLDCSPCFQRVCPLGTTACLKNLPVSMVENAVNELTADAQVVPGAASPASL
jgi:heptosyltransferase-2